MRYLLLPFTRRYATYAGALVAAILLLPLSFNDPVYWFPFSLAVMLALLGTHDLLQTRHSLLRNYPIVGHIRFLLEEIRPEIRQYFAESDTDGQPFSRSERTLAYERAKVVNKILRMMSGLMHELFEETRLIPRESWSRDLARSKSS